MRLLIDARRQCADHGRADRQAAPRRRHRARGVGLTRASRMRVAAKLRIFVKYGWRKFAEKAYNRCAMFARPFIPFLVAAVLVSLGWPPSVSPVAAERATPD